MLTAGLFFMRTTSPAQWSAPSARPTGAAKNRSPITRPTASRRNRPRRPSPTSPAPTTRAKKPPWVRLSSATAASKPPNPAQGFGEDGEDFLAPGHNLRAHLDGLEKQMRDAAANLEFEDAARIRDEIKRLQEVELAVSDDPLARQNAIEERVEIASEGRIKKSDGSVRGVRSKPKRKKS